MAVTLRQLLEKRARIVAEMREIADGADDETGGLTPEQQDAFNRLKQALSDLARTNEPT